MSFFAPFFLSILQPLFVVVFLFAMQTRSNFASLLLSTFFYSQSSEQSNERGSIEHALCVCCVCFVAAHKQVEARAKAALAQLVAAFLSALD